MGELSGDVIYCILYVLLSMCLVFSPKEFAEAGVTIENIFYFFVDSESSDFIRHHIRRTAVTVAVHGALPLGFFLGYCIVSSGHVIDRLPWLHLLTAVTSLVFVSGLLRARSWTNGDGSNHPLARTLRSYGDPWTDIAQQINAEFRSYDKFLSVTGTVKLCVLDSWLVKCSAYAVDVVRLDDASFRLVGSHERELSTNSPFGVQFVLVEVTSSNAAVKPFRCRVHAADFDQFQTKVRAPVQNSINIAVRPSVQRRFTQAFRQVVVQNQPVTVASSEVNDTCIGCFQAQPSVVLALRCTGAPGTLCQPCHCRPQWCLECMSLWFASRQSQTRPETWLSSVATCPNCRAPFCMLDVCPLTLQD